MSKNVKCGCGNLIPQERLEVLPNTKTCVKCSRVTHAHGDSRNGEIVVSKNPEGIRQMKLRYE